MKKTYPQKGKAVQATKQAFAPWNTPVILDRYAVISSLASPSSGFRLPLSWREKSLLRISALFKRVDILEHSFIVRPDAIAPYWHTILRFLHREGVIKDPRFSPHLFSNDRVKFPSIRLDGNARLDRCDGREVTVYGFGAAETSEEALSKAVGELLERFFLARYRRDDFLVSTGEALRKSGLAYLDPKSLPMFKEWQKNGTFETYTEKSVLAWVQGEELSSGEPSLIPAQLIFWNYDTVSARESVLGYHTTNGGGGHFSKERAYLSSIYENVQRDGFLIYWLNSLSPSVIDAESVADEYPVLRKRLAYLKRYNIRPIFLNTTSDIKIPSLVCAVIDDKDGKPIVSVGAGTGFDFETMALAALYESLSVNRVRLNGDQFSLPDDYKPFADKSIQRTERLSLWQGEEFLQRFNFFISGEAQSVDAFMGERRYFSNATDELKHVIHALVEAGHPIYGYEVHNTVLRRLGYHVVKSIIPGLIPMYLQENLALLGAERLRTVPEKLGYTAAKELNPWPHPFP